MLNFKLKKVDDIKAGEMIDFDKNYIKNNQVNLWVNQRCYFHFLLKDMRSLQGKHTTICNYIENVLDSVLSDEASTIKQTYLVLKVIKELYSFLFISRYPTNLVLNIEYLLSYLRYYFSRCFL